MSEPLRDIIWIRTRGPTGRDIAEEVANRHGLTLDEMLAKTQRHHIAHVRQEAMWEMRRRTNLSLPQIARILKLKDHTTIWHGVQAHEKRRTEAVRTAA